MVKIRPARTVSVLATGLGCALIVAGLVGLPGRPPTVPGREAAQPGLPASEAAWVAPDGTGTPDGRLRAGDVAGGAVTYLKFALPAADSAAAGPTRLVLTSADGSLPGLVELVSVPDTNWEAETLDWQRAPVLGPVVQSVRSPADDRVSFDVSGVLAGPGEYAFAVTVPPDLGHATFVGVDGGSGRPVLRQPGSTAAPEPTATPTAPPTPTRAAAALRAGQAPPSECVLGERLEPSCGVLWGVAPGAHTDLPRTTALTGFEDTTGRQQAIYHAYHRSQELFPTDEEVAIAEQGRVLFLNWKPLEWSWAQIASGHPEAESYLDRLAAHINETYDDPFFFTIHHEPENDVRPWRRSGWQAADYAAMYRQVVERLRGAGVDNLVTVMNHLGYVPWIVRPWWSELYPGDDVVDWIGVSAYSYSEPGYGHGDFAEMLNRRSGDQPAWPGFYNWAAQRLPEKPFMLAEWGVWHSAEEPEQMRRFYDSVARQAPLFPRVKAMVYFDTPADQRGRDSRPAATDTGLAAFGSLGERQRFQVRLGDRTSG